MVKPLLEWTMTAWSMNRTGGWKLQPVILAEGQIPFFADHPSAYIQKLQELHDNPQIARGSFHTVIGQLQDGLENAWKADSAKSIHRNGHK